jgi:ribose transport system substrate-binding protein
MHRIAISFAVISTQLILLFGPAKADPQGKRIAHVTTNVAQAYVSTIAKSLTDRAKQFGMVVSTFSSPFDAALQAQQMDDAIARKYHMIVLSPVSEQAIVPAATRAHQAGIPTIAIIVAPKAGTENLYISYIGEDQAKLGRIAGNSLVEALKASGREGGKVAAITGSLQQATAPLRMSAFRDALKANPKIELVAVEDARWDTARSQQITSQLLARFAGQGGLDAIYGMADNMAAAIVDAVEAAGMTVGSGGKDMIVVSSNCGATGIQSIKAGKLYSTATQIPSTLGERVAEAAADYFSGKTLPKVVQFPEEVINKGNVDKWAALCSF